MSSSVSANKGILNIYINDELVSTYEFDLNSQKKILIGRSAKNDIIVNSTIVSSQHAEISVQDGVCEIRDLNSTNGILIDKEKVKEKKLEKDMQIRIDNPDDPHNQGILILYTELKTDSVEKWNNIFLKDKKNIIIGRESTNDITISHSLVSRMHAEIYQEKNEWYIKDLNSTNGTFVNGKQVKSATKLNVMDTIYIGQTKFVVQQNKIIYNSNVQGLQLDAIDISKVVKDSNAGFFSEKKEKKILDHISISIKPGELVALIGGSGAGKSTFMDTINGFRPATEGTVLVNGDDFYANFNAYKNIMGYVPQQDIVYDSLTVHQMLTYAAKLRMPEDSNDQEIEQKVKEVIADVELTGREELVISQLSGGQRKRASIAVELLADPKLFFLDEPTSGLDPGMERNMMRLLRKLSNMGKTVILITHATANLHLCDKVVFLGCGGRLCYFGPPSGAQEFFNVTDYTDIYDLINNESEFWQDKFVKSQHYSYYQSLKGKKVTKHTKEKGPSRSSVKQFGILCSRYMKLTLIDRQRFLFLIIQAPIIALLLGQVSERDSFFFYESSKQIIFTAASSAVWVGLLNSIQEITKEKVIFLRERTVNLKLAPYILSKMTVLGVLGFIQSILFVLILKLVTDFPSTDLIGSLVLEVIITFFLTVVASSAFGLVISCIVANSDRAMGLAPIILIPQLIFNGLVFELKGITEFFSNFILSKWAARALSISFDLNGVPMEIETKVAVPPRDLPDYYDHSLALLYQNWGILLGISIISILLCLILLKEKKKA